MICNLIVLPKHMEETDTREVKGLFFSLVEYFIKSMISNNSLGNTILIMTSFEFPLTIKDRMLASIANFSPCINA